ncbi:DUF1403 family protein [Brucella sp. IR073]|uniref:DUF1403 family protein n=1 Tax=unclassified Brucella TaxID=2632610 RepID=UPI003B98807C
MNRPTSLVLPAAVAPPAPWARGHDLPDISEAEAAFFAGAALQALDGLIRGGPEWTGLWRARMALKAAAVSTSLLGKPEEEGALRDAVCLTRPGEDPGPAGRVLLAWRRLGRHSGAIDGDVLASIAELFGAKPDIDWKELAGQIDTRGQGGRAAPFAAIEAAEHIADGFPALTIPAELFAFWLADLTLAAGLKWPRPVPLLITQVQKSFFREGPNRRRLRIGEAGWRTACLIAYGQAALEAYDFGMDAARRAERLKLIAPKLRAKGAARIVEALLQDDALLPSAWVGVAPGQGMTDRAVRRLFERLLTLGAVRELTGRPTFRLYGL